MTGIEGATVETVAEVPPPPPGLPYDPEAVFLSVKDWVYDLSIRYAKRRGLADVGEDLGGELALIVWQFLVEGRYDPDRGSPSNFVFQVARSHLFPAMCHVLNTVYVPAARLARGRENLPEHIAAVMRPMSAAGPRHGIEGTIDPPDHRPLPDEEASGRLDGEAEQEAMEEALGRLAPHERDILRRHYLEGETHRSIGLGHGVSGARICEVKLAAVARLRAILAGDHVPPCQGLGTSPQSSLTAAEFLVTAEACGWDATEAGARFGLSECASYQRAVRLVRAGRWPIEHKPTRPHRDRCRRARKEVES